MIISTPARTGSRPGPRPSPGQDVEVVQRGCDRNEGSDVELPPEPARGVSHVGGYWRAGPPAILTVGITQIEKHPPERARLSHLFRGAGEAGGERIGRGRAATGGLRAARAGTAVDVEPRFAD